MVRLLIILGMIRREMTKLLYPKAVVPLTLNKTPIDEKVCIAVLAYFMVWLTSFVIGAAVLLLAGLPPGDAISAAWSRTLRRPAGGRAGRAARRRSRPLRSPSS
mgnify:CR=1 FL=1